MADLDLLARQAASGDRRSFESVCRTLEPDVWRYCYALTGDREMALDAVQETFLGMVKGIRRFRGDAPVRVWTLAIARRVCADTIRREMRRLDRPYAAPPETVYADSTGWVDAADLLNLLEPEFRQAFVLTQVLGMSYRETAEVAGCRVGTIRSRVFRARSRLVEALDGVAAGGTYRGQRRAVAAGMNG